jgi:hypothetical protein
VQVDDIPQPLRRSLSRDDADDVTVELLSVGEDGWPHLALLSVGEVLPLTGPHVRLALWPGSSTAGNLVRTGRATLAAVSEQVAYRVQLQVSSRGDLIGPHGPASVFDGRAVAVREDVAPYAVLESGVQFRLTDPVSTLARWTATRRWLRELAPLIG